MSDTQPLSVDFSNSKLMFRHARSGPDDQYHDHAWTSIAAANMVKGDTLKGVTDD
jgi:hypothetical protein